MTHLVSAGRQSQRAMALCFLAIAFGLGLSACETPKDCNNTPGLEGCGVPPPPEPPRDSYRIGEPFQDCPDCPWMVIVPSGANWIGELPVNAPDGDYDERDPYRASFEEFAIGVYEVTFAEWDSCVRAEACRGHRPNDKGWGRHLRPAINISWDDANAFVVWLNSTTNRTYRLPTEEEWEYAARAGTMTSYAFGNKVDTAQVNYDGKLSWNGSAKGEFRGQTLPVRVWNDRNKKLSHPMKPNAFGLYHMHGNVSEWTQDCYTPDYRGDKPAYDGPCAFRTLRGGAWIDGPFKVRSAWRHPLARGERHNFVGFRVARSVNR
jgi:formylglycine-generating enzyme required for sulfatase activity